MRICFSSSDCIVHSKRKTRTGVTCGKLSRFTLFLDGFRSRMCCLAHISFTRSYQFRPTLLPPLYQRGYSEETQSLLLSLLASGRSVNAVKDALQKMGLSSCQQELERVAAGLIEELDLHSSLQSFPFGPATLWRRVQSRCAMGAGGTSQLSPNDAVTRMRGKCDGGPDGTPYNGPMSLTRPDVVWGPRFTSTAPCRSPRPSPHRIPLWAGHSMGASAEHVRWVRRSFQISAPR